MPEPAVATIRTHSSIHRLVDSQLNQTRPAGRHAESSDTSKLPARVCMTRPSAPVLFSDLNTQKDREGGDMNNPDPVMLYLEHFF
jgi:hypothetical protein